MTQNLKRFAHLIDETVEPPSSDVQAVGHLMRQWLQNVIADAGTAIDTGAGFNQYDLWVTVGGKELFITIKGKP